jgi:hypothetical protein
MWFSGHNGILTRQIGYATSTDSIHWTKYENNPVLKPGPGGSWEDQWVDSPDVLLIEGMYHMWYGGNDGNITQIGHATSADGVTWEKDPQNPVLTVGTSGAWDNLTVSNPTVLYEGHTFHMWYGAGQNFAWDWKTGYAVSVDGSNWEKLSIDGPVMDLGEAGEWDDQFVAAGGSEIIMEIVNGDTLFKMWYGGGNADGMGHIGFAASDTSEFDPVVSVEDNNFNVITGDFSLSQNYPNPFNPKTIINYQLAMTSDVNLSIYNMLGQKVATLVNKKQKAGNYSMQWDASGFASGVYYYRLNTDGGFVQTKKLILLR